MAQYFVSASDSDALNRFTRRIGWISLDIINDGGEDAIRCRLPRRADPKPHMFSLDEAGEFTDGEMVVRFRLAPAVPGFAFIPAQGIAARSSDTETTLYSGGASRMTSAWITSYVAGTLSLLANYGDVPDTGAYTWYRLRQSGTSLKLRFWTGTAGDEPAAWTLETTDAGITAAGWWGLFCSGDSSTVSTDYDHLWTHVGLGTGVDPAPTGPVGGAGVTITPTAAISESVAYSPEVSAATATEINPPAARSVSAAYSPTVSTGTSVSPAAARSASAAHSPSLGSGAVVNVETARSASQAHSPTISTGASVQPDAVRSVSQARSPSVAAGASVTPVAVRSQSTAHDPSVDAGPAATVTPEASRSVSGAPNPTVAAGASVHPVTARSESRAYSPALGSGVVVSIETARSVSRAYSPTARAGASVSPAAARSVSTALSPAVSGGATVTPITARSQSAALRPLVEAGLNRWVKRVTIQGTYARRVTITGEYNRKLRLTA